MTTYEFEPTATVVVCSYNGGRTLSACLEALSNQTIAAAIQIVVVDDGSTDDTSAIAESYGCELISHGENRGLSAARNTGIAAARASIVAFTDADCIPDRFWIERLVTPYSDPAVVGVGGTIGIARVNNLVHKYLEEHNPLKPLELSLAERLSLWSRLVLHIERMWVSRIPTESRPVFSYAGANMSFRTSVLRQIGGFDPSIRFGSDDEYICEQVRKNVPEGVLWFQPDAVVAHDFVGSLHDVWRRNVAYGRGHAYMFENSPDSRWPIVFPGPLVLLVALCSIHRTGRLAMALAALCVLYPQGVRAACTHRDLRRVVFSAVRMVEEIAHNLGMLQFFIAKHREPSRND